MTHCFQYIMKRASATNPHWHMQPLTVVYGESAPSRVLIQKIAMVWHGLWINRTCWHCKLTVSNFALDLFTADSNIQSELSHKFTARPIDSVYSPPPLSALIVLFEYYVKVTAHWLLCLVAHSITNAVHQHKLLTWADQYDRICCWLQAADLWYKSEKIEPLQGNMTCRGMVDRPKQVCGE